MVQFNLPKNSKIVKGKTYGKPNNLSLQIYRWNREDGSNPRIDIFNLDKIGYASDIYEINRILSDNNLCNRYKFLKVDLKDIKEVQKAIKISDPDLIIHLAAESHVVIVLQNSS